MRIPHALAQLGTVLELRVEKDGKRSTLSWPKKGLWLCTDSTQKRLYLVPAPKAAPGPLAGPAKRALKGVARAYKRWSEFEAANVTPATVELGATEDRGCVASIAYRSDKWSGRAEDYEHDFKGRPRLCCVGSVYVISGGGFSVTPSGIRG
ncbi:hypothetical protein [Hyalangium versicolor]|uniref:hypothetical protein n=1 Tax=Hyalangium versicolor TaxID=2861190 RepID=UPI001CCCFD5B|nr:hypothetical protein [Hyalangium versicolor]